MLPWMQQFFLKYKKALTVIFLSCGVLFFVVSPLPAAAQGDVLGVNQVGNNLLLGGDDIRVIIAKIIRAALALVGIIVFVYMIWAGFTIMTSAGNEEKVATGKRMMTNAVIGLIIIMSSVAIVQFVLAQLQQATGAGAGDGAGGNRPGIENFMFAGALGQTVKDHYPFREQTGVKRNTRIAISFFPAILPSSIIENTNGSCVGADGTGTIVGCEFDADGNPVNPYYGDCVFPEGQVFNQAVHCDHIIPEAVRIFISEDQRNGVAVDPNAPDAPLIDAIALATYEDGAERNARTFVFQPVAPLGKDDGDVWYTVALGDDILTKAEAQLLNVPYIWEFQTNTEFDFDPPHVVDVYPREGTTGFRNSIVKITFNEPVDPTVVQGLSGPNTPFSHIIFNDPAGDPEIRGEWKISNAYRTVEFVSDSACGLNSCGETMYCLPVQCADGNDQNCVTPFEILVRTAVRARPDIAQSFEAVPLSGVMDMSGNALDGRIGADTDGDGTPQGKPNVVNVKQIAPADGNNAGERAADNFWWTFRIRNSIDTEPPFIADVRPRLDEEDVIDLAELSLEFSKPMWSQTLDGIVLVEYPNLGPMWKVPRSFENEQGNTRATIAHRIFGPNNVDVYYFAGVSSTVKSVTQNCLYPGRGPLYQDIPGNGAVPICRIDENGDFHDCVGVDAANPNRDSGCMQRVQMADNALLQPGIGECIDFLQREDISPTDRDDDGRDDIVDNCPNDANPDQKDQDGDALGDVCDV